MALLLKHDGSFECLPLRDDDRGRLEDLQKAVGGYIEAVRLSGRDGWRWMIVNEHGKLDGLPLNPAAKLFIGDIDDYIVGDVVLLREDEID